MSQFTKKLSLHFLIILLLTSVVVFYSSSQFSVHYKNHRPKEIDSQLKRHASFTLKANPGEEVFDCSLNPDQKPCYQGNHIEPMYFGGLVRGHIWVFVPLLFSLVFPAARPTFFKRGAVYVALCIYRALFLYVTLNQIENKLTADAFDFSDHVVFRMLWLLVTCIEWTYVTTLPRKMTGTLLQNLSYLVFTMYCAAYTVLALYFTYWTCLYFHTPIESRIGYVVGTLGLFGMFYSVGNYFSFSPFEFQKDRDLKSTQ